jgi:hypothetical protein
MMTEVQNAYDVELISQFTDGNITVGGVETLFVRIALQNVC